LISLYSHQAVSEDDREEWIRKQALLVLIYEGVVAQVLDYDYAPASELVELRRKYFNVSQEGKSDVDFLREEELINGLKLSSKSYQPVTCFQISDKGEEIVKKLSRKEKERVHEMVYAPGSKELLRIQWDGEDYWLQTDSGFKRKSTCTDTEEVSYVSSAYVPQCLRHGGRPTLSNAHRAHESGDSEGQIRDELDEVITLNSVSIIVAEYIPFGANQIVQLNQNLGSTERVQGGFYTALVDDDESGTNLNVQPGLTSVNILDYSLTNHINFEADIHFPTEGDIVQVETFGVSMNSEGTCFYGMQIEAVMNRIKDNISLDHMARLLVDVHIDSSKIVDSVISAYQRQLLDLVFMGDASNRDKVNLIISNEITPHLTAEEYMDKGEYENELKQVLGDTRSAFDISEHDTLIFGEHGILVAGPNSRHHEPLLCSYLQFISMDIFVRNFFNRMFIITDDMQNTQIIIDDSGKDPLSVERIQAQLNMISKDIILMIEVLSYMAEALDEIEVPPEPPEQSGRSLYERLQIMEMKEQISRRVKDLGKNMEGIQHELHALREQSSVVVENKNFRINESVKINTKTLCDLQDANLRASNSLDLLLILSASTLAFDILDRFTGEWTVVNTVWFFQISEIVFGTEGVWFIISLSMWVICAYFLMKINTFMAWKSQGTITLRIEVMQKIHVDKLKEFFQEKPISAEARFTERENEIVKITYIEKDTNDWNGAPPTINMEYEENFGFLLSITLAYSRRMAKKNLAFNASELKSRLEQELDTRGIYDKDHDHSFLLASQKARLEAGKDKLSINADGDDDDDDDGDGE
jgi:WD repeat-containing protein 35